MKITLLGLLVVLGAVLLIVYAVEMQQRKNTESKGLQKRTDAES